MGKVLGEESILRVYNERGGRAFTNVIANERQRVKQSPSTCGELLRRVFKPPRNDVMPSGESLWMSHRLVVTSVSVAAKWI